MEWTVGLQDFKKCSLNLGEDSNHFTTELTDVEFERGRDIADIFYDHLAVRQTKYVEVLYSGGMDSELVLLCCLRKKIPVKAMTLAIKINGMIINAHDLYYAERFCRENTIEQTILELDAVDFYENGKYYNYLAPYYITEPHVATHFWLLEHCSHFPVLGGDWPWTQTHKTHKILSPYKLEFSSYERFMWDKGIMGIGNMISDSLESNYRMIELHLANNKGSENIEFLKHRMYNKIEPMMEPRIKSWGWEIMNHANFNFRILRKELLQKLKPTTHSIKWGKTICDLLDTPFNTNDTFK